MSRSAPLRMLKEMAVVRPVVSFDYLVWVTRALGENRSVHVAAGIKMEMQSQLPR